MLTKVNWTTVHRGLAIECWTDSQRDPTDDEPAHIVINRTLDPDKSASLDFILETGCFSDDKDTPLTSRELTVVEEIRVAYTEAGLF